MRSTATAAIVALLAFAACLEDTAPKPPIPRWEPGFVFVTPREPTVRGLLDRRGLIHAHSVYSHDACDEAPVDVNGVPDPVCFDDFRSGLCDTRQDFVMLTDHADAFRETEFPDVLLYREERGDILVQREGAPVSSWAMCEDGRKALVLAGSESGLMPVGLERHPLPLEERGLVYGVESAEAAATLRSAGAVVLVAHTEEFTAEELTALDVDGFEMFNMHANRLLNAVNAIDLVQRVNAGDPGLLYPDLVALPLLSEDERYLSTWGTALSSGRRFVTTMGLDCHRNTFA